MQYLISFLEGIITFISPCLLPMLPIYLSYFAGGQVRNAKKTLLGACGFVLGFSIVFIALGMLAGTLGSLLNRHQTLVDLISGAIVIVFGFNHMGILKLDLFSGMRRPVNIEKSGFFPAMLFGVIFSVGWTPCVGAFLGAALVMASQQRQVLGAMGMLLCYCIGLGIPFLISAVLIDKLKTTFDFIKKHYAHINLLSGAFLILVGILMAAGLLGRWITLLG